MLDRAGPPDAAARSRGSLVPAARRVPGWLAAAFAGVTVLLAVLVPLAPVVAADPVVSWPPAGQPVRSTALPLAPYRPLSLHATIPCAALRAGGEVLRTLPARHLPTATPLPPSQFTPSDSGLGQGLTVTGGSGRIRVSASGAAVLDEPLPRPDPVPARCAYQVAADGSGVVVSRDGAVLATQPDLPVPQVAELATSTPGAPGLAVTLHTDDRYDSRPSPLKTALLAALGLALAGTLALAWRRWRGAVPGPVRPRRPAVRWGLPDAVVLVVCLGWVLLGPMGFDDAWYELMARDAGVAGYVGNQIYMFNVTESPFVASQYLMQAWGALGGWSLWWMRLLPVGYGLTAWVLLRVLLATTLGRLGRRRAVGWALLVGHLTWWLPYGITLRPEPLVATATAATMLLAELARRRRSVGVLAVATAVAALALTVSPAGLVAAAPLVLALTWLWPWLRARRWRTRAAAVLTLAAATTGVVLVAFADASLGDVTEAAAVHDWYYLTYPWYEEWVHYQTLLDNDNVGSWGRRGPVVLTLAVLAVVAVGSGRRAAVAGPVRRLMLTAAVTTAAGLGLLAESPTKWVDHFGAVAAPATVLLALTLLHSPLPRRASLVARLTSVALLVGAAVLTFAGPNLWHPYTDRGQPFGDHLARAPSMLEIEALDPHVGPLYPRDGWVWLAVAAAAAGWVWWRRRRGRGTHAVTPDRAVLAGTAGLVVVGMVGVFLYAPLHQAPGWTVAASGLEALRGKDCGLAQHVRVLADADTPLGAPIGSARLQGDFARAARDPAPVPAPAPGPVWHDAVADGTSSGTGTLATPWYPVPAPGDATHVTVPVVGNDLAAQRLVVEFRPGGTAPLVPDPALTDDDWQELAVPLPVPRPSALRVVVEDRVAGADTWIALSPPRLTRYRPLTELTAGTPTFADQLSAALWPCVEQVGVVHGIARSPAVELLADEGITADVLANPTFEAWGGTFVQDARTATYVRLRSQITPGGPATLPWGQVERVLHDPPVGGYGLTVGATERAGWTRLPTLASQTYTGRSYFG